MRQDEWGQASSKTVSSGSKVLRANGIKNGKEGPGYPTDSLSLHCSFITRRSLQQNETRQRLIVSFLKCGREEPTGGVKGSSGSEERSLIAMCTAEGKSPCSLHPVHIFPLKVQLSESGAQQTFLICLRELAVTNCPFCPEASQHLFNVFCFSFFYRKHIAAALSVRQEM